MSKEEIGAQAGATASEETKVQGTQIEEVEQSSPSNVENDDAEIEVITESSDESSKDQNDKETKEKVETGDKQPPQRNLEAEATKMSLLESENHKLKQGQPVVDESIQTFDEVYRDDPEAYEAFRKAYLKKHGRDLGSHASVYGVKGNEDANMSTLMQDPEAFLQAVNKIVDEKVNETLSNKDSQKEIEAGLFPFWEEHPELDLRKEDVNLVKSKAISTAAAAYKEFNPKLTWGDALKMAYIPFSGEIEEQVEEARTNGEIVGRQAAMSASVGKDGGAISSGSPANSSKPKYRLTPGQKDAYERLLRTKGTSIASNFARLATIENRNNNI